MKKITILSAVLAAGLLLSCNKEVHEIENTDLSVPSGMKEVTITANVDESVTKTTYSDAGVFSWTKGDKISVMGSDRKFYTFTANQTGKSSTFTGSLPEDCSISTFAFYPADDAHYEENWQPYFNIPEYKDLSSSFSADLPMSANKAEDGTFTFKHITAALLMTFTNIPDDIKTVEISFKNSSMKFSGLFKIYTGEPWTWNTIENGVTESEMTYTRKVSVKDNKAQMYIPYKGVLWNGFSNTISVLGYDGTGHKYVLLENKNMPGKDLKLKTPGMVIPVAPVVLSSLAYVDWNADNIVTTSVDPLAEFSKIKELKVTADEYFMYVRLTTMLTSDFAGNYLDIFLSDGEGAESAWYGWTTKGTDIYKVGLSGHKGTIDLNSGELSGMKFLLPGDISVDVDFKTEVSGDDIIWYLVYPRTYLEPYVSSEGKIYLSFMLWNGWDPYGVIPTIGTSMLEVTLP